MKLLKLLKRVIDVTVSLFLLILLSPILIISVCAVFVLEGRPVFYVSRRYISVGKIVSIIKLRSMVKDAKSPKYNLKGRYMRDGYLNIPLDCEVYTGIGRLLEKTQLVEVPQLINILFNGMSLIGNRPLPAENVEKIEKITGWQNRFACPAGITGISQIVGKHNLEPIERLKLEGLYSRVYNEGNVIKCDLIIAYYTVRLVLFGRQLSVENAYQLLKGCLVR